MKKQITYRVFAAAVTLIGSANAAAVSWSDAIASTAGSPNGITLDTGLFDTTGTLIRAENSGGIATLFDGIDFISGVTSLGRVHGSAYHTSASPLSRSGTYSSLGAQTVTLTDLTVGNTYRVQTLLFDGRSSSSGNSVEFDGIDQGTYANGDFGITTWGSGLIVTGVFIADAASQDFNIEVFDDSSTSRGSQLNAFTLYQTSVVPEPSFGSLLGLGGLALILRRRK